VFCCVLHQITGSTYSENALESKNLVQALARPKKAVLEGARISLLGRAMPCYGFDEILAPVCFVWHVNAQDRKLAGFV
jgi:hypothetical protein